MSEKSVFRETLVLKLRRNHSQSPVFSLTVLCLTGGEILRFRCVKTRGRKIATEYLFCYTYQYIVEMLLRK